MCSLKTASREHFKESASSLHQLLAPYTNLYFLIFEKHASIKEASNKTYASSQCLALCCHTENCYVKHCISAGYHMVQLNSLPDIWWGSGHWEM